MHFRQHEKWTVVVVVDLVNYPEDIVVTG
jgi:hypothetical protein